MAIQYSFQLCQFPFQNMKITVNDFLDTMMSDPGPPALVWLPLLHRIANAENGKHIPIMIIDLLKVPRERL